MLLFVRILLAILISVGAIWASVALYGVVVVWSPFPTEWWIHHSSWVSFGSKTLAVFPSVAVLGFVLWKIFKERAVLYSLLSTAVALAISLASSIGEPLPTGSVLSGMIGVFGSLLFGPPLLVLLLGRLRSNKSLERTRGE
jgi:hypothetical protein